MTYFIVISNTEILADGKFPMGAAVGVKYLIFMALRY